MHGFLRELGPSGTEFQELTAFGQQAFRSVSQNARVTHPDKALRNHVEQEAADKFMGLEGHGLFPVVIFAVAVTEGDFTVMGRKNPIIGQRHAMDVAAEVVEHMDGRAERFFGIDDPGFFP